MPGQEAPKIITQAPGYPERPPVDPGSEHFVTGHDTSIANDQGIKVGELLDPVHGTPQIPNLGPGDPRNQIVTGPGSPPIKP